ncbi:hypothetical protein [Flaviaesturariibacter amylovorans]|uniref:Uncharacterized protein n=1 Tax=Flaviaesturariibacter amylovorans TaxID=1084520 RepID=A0ABP8G6Z8_9BACT
MRNALIAGALLVAGSVSAQRVSVSWGEESKTELSYGSLVRGNGTDMVKLCFENKGGGMFSKRTTTPILARYNNRLREEGVRSYNASEEGVNFDNLLSVGGNLFMFTNRYERSDKTTYFYSQKIDPKTLMPSGAPVNLGTMAALDRSRQSTADYEISKDSSKILMFGLSPFSKKNNEKYYMAVYNNQMAKQWDNTVELPYLDKFIVIFDYLVTNNGDVGVLIKHYDKEVKKEKIREDGANVPAYKTKFLLYAKGAAKPKEFTLDLKDKFVHDLQLTSDDNNNLTLFGLYKNKYDGYVNGYFITTLNSSADKVETNKMEAFPETLVDLVKKDKQGSNKEKDPGLSSYFTLADVVTRADGSTDYLLEYYKKVIVTRSSGGGPGISITTSYSYPIYHYGDVIDIHVTNGKPTSFIRLPKYQETANTNMFSSFKAATANNKLFLFYNDDRDNVERDIEKRPDDMIKFTKSILALATIDQRDNLTRSMVYDHKEMKLTTCVRVSQRLGNSVIGLYAQRMGGMFSSAKDMVGLLELK